LADTRDSAVGESGTNLKNRITLLSGSDEIGHGKSPKQLKECVGNGAFDEAKSLNYPLLGIF